MSDTDEMTDSSELHELRAAVSAVAVPDPPSVDGIRAIGRARRRHRRYGVAVVSGVAAAGVGLAVGLTGSSDSTPSGQLASSLGTVRTAAYTLVSNADGTATLTINPAELFDPTRLQDDLASDGITAKVTVGSMCTSDPTPSGFGQVVSLDPGTAGSDGEPGVPATVTIDPSAMPTGAELSIGELPLPRDMKWSALTLVDTNGYTCSSTPPWLNSENGGLPFNRGDGMAFIMIPGGSSGS